MLTDTIYQSLKSVPSLQRQFKRVVLKLPHRQRLVNHFQCKLWVDPAELHGFYLYYEREYDDYIFEFLLTQVRNLQSKYHRAIDIGANIGIYTTFLAQISDHVDAFEPEKQVLAGLRKNLSLNGINNVAIHEKCVGQFSGNVGFTSPDKHNQGVGSISLESGINQVPCITLDDFLSGVLSESCLIKMDIEGGEWLALQGAREALTQRKAPVSILLEVHPEEIERLGGTVKELKQLLESMRLEVSALTPQGLKPLPDHENWDFRFWWASSEV